MLMEGVFIDVTAFLIRFVDFPHGILHDRQSCAWVRVWVMEVAAEFCNRSMVSTFIDALDLTNFEMTPILTVLTH